MLDGGIFKHEYYLQHDNDITSAVQVAQTGSHLLTQGQDILLIPRSTITKFHGNAFFFYFLLFLLKGLRVQISPF